MDLWGKLEVSLQRLFPPSNKPNGMSSLCGFLLEKKKEYVSLCGIPSLAQTATPPPLLSRECVESPQMRLGSRLACLAGWFEQEDIYTAEAQVKRLLPSQSVLALPASPTAPKPPHSPDCNTEVLASSIKYSIYRSSQLSGGSLPPRD